MNTAADVLSRLDLDPKETVQLLIRDDIQTAPIEVHIQSSNVAEEEQFYFLPEDDIETEEQIWERKQRSRKKILENDSPQTPGAAINNETTHPEEITIIFQTEITRRTENTEECLVQLIIFKFQEYLVYCSELNFKLITLIFSFWILAVLIDFLPVVRLKYLCFQRKLGPIEVLSYFQFLQYAREIS